MAELFAFELDQVQRIRRVLNLVEGNSTPSLRRMPRNLLTAAAQVVGILESSIAATTSLIGPPKMGTLNIYSFSSTGTVDTGVDETVFSFAPSVATTDRWSVCGRDALTGRLILHTQFCS